MSTPWLIGTAAEVMCVTAAVVTGAFALRRRRTAPTSAPWLALVMAGIVLWALSGLVLRTTDVTWLRLASVHLFTLSLPVLVSGYLLLARSLVDSSYRPSRVAVGLLLVDPALVLALMASPWRRLVVGTVPTDPVGDLVWTPGPLFWAHAGYAYVVFAAGALVELLALRHVADSHRAQLVSNLVASLVPLAGCVALTLAMADSAGGLRAGQVDAAACGFVATSLINLWALSSQGLFTVLPVARGLVLQELSDAVFIVDRTGHLVDRNTAADELLAHCGRRIARVTREVSLTDIVECLGPDVRAENGQYPIRTPVPREIDVRLRDVCTGGRRYGTALVIRDITGLNRSRRQVQAANEELRRQVATVEALRLELQDQAHRDVLTGVHNRRRFEQVLAETYTEAQRTAAPFSIAVVDIDFFKAVNDRFGHLVGDDVLVAVAQLLTDEATADEQVFRFGGEEFVVILPGVGRAGALSRGWDYASRTACTDIGGVTGLELTTSIGVATFPDDGEDPMSVLQAADSALYRAKALGRARVEAASPVRLVRLRDVDGDTRVGPLQHQTA